MKRLLIVAAVALLPFAAHAQFIFGWSGGYAIPRELNREIYIYNAVNRQNLTKEMDLVHWYNGPVVGLRFGEVGFAEMYYSRKRAMVSSEFDSTGIEMARQLKVLCNTYQFGGGVYVGKVAFGASIDLGRFKGFGRRGVKASLDDTEFERLWVRDRTRIWFISAYRLYVATTVYAELKLSIFAIRAFAQFGANTCKMDGLDRWLFGSPLNAHHYNEDRFTNYGLMLSIQLGGYKP